MSQLLIKTLSAFLEKEGIHDTHIICALSGGADSMVLLHSLCQVREEFGLQISALHVNHGIRGTEAERDEMFCVSRCHEYGVPCCVYHLDVPLQAEEQKLSLETAAREARYRVFNEVLEQMPDAYIATAHNATDNAETLLFRMARGTALRGLCGIPSKRGKIIRPLLKVSARDIRSYATEKQVSFVVDSTNLETAYTRNYVRQELVPRLEAVHEGALEHISYMVECLEEDEMYLSQEAKKLACKTHLRQALRNAPNALAYRALRFLYEKVQVSKDALTREHLEEMLSLIRSENTNAVVTLPAGVLFHMERDELFFTIGGEEELTRTDIHTGETILPNECGVFVVSTSPITQDTFPTLNVYRNLIYSSVNSATIKGSLYVRAKMDGDSYCYGGMTHKVKRLFSDKKLPLSLRKKWPILCDDAGILWVPGFSVRDSISDETHKFYFCYGYNMEDQK